MKKIFALALIAIFAISCGAPEDKQKQLEEKEKEYAILGKEIKELKKELAKNDTTTTINTTPIRFKTIEIKEFKRSVEIQGIVESDKNIVISSEVAGRIVAVLVKEGQKVSQGQTIARVNGDITANSIQEIENTLKLAEITYTKQKNLYAQNVGTEMQLLRAENQRDALKRKLTTLRSQYGKYNITSPVSGTVDDLSINVGENIMPGMPIARVVNNKQLKVTANVSEKYIPVVQRGNNVKVQFPSIGTEMDAKIGAIGQIINPANRTFSMVINLNKTSKTLKPNLLAIVTIYDYINPEALAIPSNIIINDGTGNFIYILKKKGENHIAKKRTIETGKVSGAYIEITKGLKAGEKVITENYKNLIDGAIVNIIK